MNASLSHVPIPGAGDRRDAVSAEPARQRPSVALLAAAIAAVALAAVLYQPWRAVPFDIIDFSEFLPLLQRPGGAVARLSGFLTYYASQGRFNVVAYVALLAKWALLGSHPARWQLARFLQMGLIVALVYRLARRLGATPRGAAAGASLFIAAAPAAPAWIRLTMGEPLALVALLAAALLAADYRWVARWRRSAVAIGALLTAAVLTKEMLVVLTPFVLGLALRSADDGHETRPAADDGRIWWLLGGTTIALVIALAAVAWVALHAPRDAYAAEYGAAPVDAGRALDLAARMLLPMRAEYAPHIRLGLLPANLAFAVLVVVGWRAALSKPATRRRWLPIAGAAAVLLAVGTVTYLPWPTFNEFYGLPFLLTPALLLAGAVSALESTSKLAGRLALAATAAVVGLCAMSAGYASRQSMARREVNYELARLIGAHPELDSVVVAMPFISSQRWQGVGPTLRRYAAALYPGARLPHVDDVLCAETIPLYRSGMPGAMLITYADRCGSFPVSTRTIRRTYSYLYWPSLAVRIDSARADVLAPGLEESR
jgi:hypothetical protein